MFFGSNIDFLLYLRGAFLGNTQRFTVKTLSIKPEVKSFIKKRYYYESMI